MVKSITGKIEEINFFPYQKKEKGELTGETGKRYVLTINGMKLATFDEGIYDFFSEGDEVDCNYTVTKIGDNVYNNIKNLALCVTAPKISEGNLKKITAAIVAGKSEGKRKVYKVIVEELEDE